MTQTIQTDTLGIILVDHGSRLASANDMLNDVAQLFRSVSGQQIVESAHMELAAPTIADAFSACVAQVPRASLCIHIFYRRADTALPIFPAWLPRRQNTIQM